MVFHNSGLDHAKGVPVPEHNTDRLDSAKHAIAQHSLLATAHRTRQRKTGICCKLVSIIQVLSARKMPISSELVNRLAVIRYMGEI